jgi:hypothetical protein
MGPAAEHDVVMITLAEADLHGLLQLSPQPPGLPRRRQNTGQGAPRPHLRAVAPATHLGRGPGGAAAGQLTDRHPRGPGVGEILGLYTREEKRRGRPAGCSPGRSFPQYRMALKVLFIFNTAIGPPSVCRFRYKGRKKCPDAR